MADRRWWEAVLPRRVRAAAAAFARPEVMSAAKVAAIGAKPPELDTERGVSGTELYGGVIAGEEYNADLQGEKGRETWDKMRKSDAMVRATLQVIKLPLRAAVWQATPPANGDATDQAIADFVHASLFDDDAMRDSWDRTLSHILLMLDFGHSELERVWRADDKGFFRLKRLAPRLPRTIHFWHVAPDGSLIRVWQYAPVIDPEPQQRPIRQTDAVPLPPPSRYQYIPIPAEVLCVFTHDREGDNYEGRSILRGAYKCFSADTDLLTKRGWCNVLAIEPDDEVATLGADGVLEYQRPSHLHQYQYSGELVHLSSRFLDQLVTTNHRCYVRKRYGHEYQIVEAADVDDRHWHTSHATWSGVEASEFEIPDYHYGARMRGGARTTPAVRVGMDDWLRFLAIYLAEGSCGRYGNTRQARVTVSQKAGPSADQIELWVRRLGIPVYVHPKGKGKDAPREGQLCFDITSAQLHEYLARFGKSDQKFVPQFVKDLSARQIRIFLNSYHVGDGISAGGGMVGSYGPYPRTKIYATVSRRMADDLSELILKAGGVPAVRWQPDAAGSYPSTIGGVWLVTEQKPREHRATRIDRVPYDGMVGCVTVPNGLVYARRNGKSQWSGNSWFYKDLLYHLDGIRHDRYGVGIPVGKLTAEASVTDENLDKIEEVLKALRANERSYLVEPVGVTYRIMVPEGGGGTTVDAVKMIDHHDAMIARNVLAGFLTLGREPHGTRAFGTRLTDFFISALYGVSAGIAGEMKQCIVKPLVDLNFDMSLPGGKRREYPSIQVRDLESTDIDRLLEVALKAIPTLITPDDDLEDWARKSMRLPPRPEGTTRTPDERMKGGPPQPPEERDRKPGEQPVEEEDVT